MLNALIQVGIMQVRICHNYGIPVEAGNHCSNFCYPLSSGSRAEYLPYCIVNTRDLS